MNSAKADFQLVLKQAQTLVDSQLKRVEVVIRRVDANAPSGIAERLASLFERKGKRIRSTLLCLIAHSGEQAPDEKRVADACASVELLHLASLVHDDIIDDTEVRRGQKTAHKEWGTQIAVLIGDYVLSQAMRCVINEEERSIPVIISDAADRLIIGEIMELDHSGNTKLSRNLYNEIINGKTAALIEAAARIGGILAGFGPELVEKCAKMGSYFGLAFQIIDDLLDYGIGSTNLDKAKFTDLSNGLITLPLLYYFENCSSEERVQMENLIAKASEEGIPEQIIALLEAKGVFNLAKEEAQNYLDKALEVASEFPKSDFADRITEMFLSMSNRSF